MAKMTAEDAKRVLKEDVGFTDEQLAGLNAEQLNKIAGGYMRQSEFDTQFNALKVSQQQLEDANTRLNSEMAEWATVQASGQQVTQQMRDDLEKAQMKVTQLTSRVTRLATDAGFDPAKALEGLEAPVTTSPTNAPDLSGYMKTSDLDAAINQRLGGLASGILDVPAELAAIADEHRELFNKRLDTREIVKEIKARASTRGNQKSLDPREVWHELHGVPAAITAKTQKERADEIAAAEARGRDAARSEMMVPGSTAAPGTRSVVFADASKQRESALKRPQPGETVRTAASALQSGKYRKTGAGT